MNIVKITCAALIVLLSAACSTTQTPEPVTNTPSENPGSSGLAPYSANSYYWSYKGSPVLLLGGSKDDNLFQVSNLEEHLDEMQQVGANYIRNTMSSRDEANLEPFKKLSDGKYDLNKWNEAYWDRFETMLKLTSERNIFVQIEFWDQWDYNLGQWNTNPWNPQNNINYALSETRLKGDNNYIDVLHNTGNQHDLFLTVPELHNDDIVLEFQKKYIRKILSYALTYDHVMYTITNELFDQHSIEWSLFWIDFVQDEAESARKDIYVTEMFQNNDISTTKHRVAFNNPGEFNFLDISQNSGFDNQTHWDNLQWAYNYIADNPRPINHNKTYGADAVSWTKGDDQGIERFWRNIIGGAASVRFHRPTAGLGLNSKAQVQIQSARTLLDAFNIFEARPDAGSSKLINRSADEAYLSFIPGKQYAVYFPDGGAVELDLRDVGGQFNVEWLNINANSWRSGSGGHGDTLLTLQTPDGNSWVALVTAK